MTNAESKRLARVGANAATAVAERDRLIREMYANGTGASLREIATAVGTITHSAVARIVKR